MSSILTALIVMACLCVAIFVGMQVRRLIPADHWTSETKDTVKLAMGLVATMSALLLGLLVSSAKNSYDQIRDEVIGMGSKLAFLDRLLAAYGPEAAETRDRLHGTADDAIRQIWPEKQSAAPQLAPQTQAGVVVYAALQQLSPETDLQRALKTRAVGTAEEIGEARSLLAARSVTSISKPMLAVVVCWLVVIFLSFSVLAPANSTSAVALLIAAFSVASAVLLILELDRPFGGIIQISSEPLTRALGPFKQ